MKRYNTSVVTLLLLCLGITTAQSDTPACIYQSSDFDGDGFGYENNVSCLITENSSGEAPRGSECVDSDGDGWGWNGTASCATPIQAPACVDTAPVGDGWGWDGASSCLVGPGDIEAQEPVFNEVNELQKHFIDVSVPGSSGITRAAVVVCPGASFSPYYFRYDGVVRANTRSGLWSTGISTSDKRLLLAITNRVSGGVFYVPFRISENGVWEGENQTVDNKCEWLQP